MQHLPVAIGNCLHKGKLLNRPVVHKDLDVGTITSIECRRRTNCIEVEATSAVIELNHLGGNDILADSQNIQNTLFLGCGRKIDPDFPIGDKAKRSFRESKRLLL